MRFLLSAALAATLPACSDDPTGPRVGDIVIQPAELRLRQREAHRLDVSVTDAAGTLLSGVAVTFASTDESIVTVSSIGTVTSVGPAGSATVRVSAGGFTKNLPVTVEGIATGVRVQPGPIEVPQQGTLALQAAVVDLIGDPIPGQPFTFESLAPHIVTVDPAGVLTSVGPHGTGEVVVRSGDLEARVDVTVAQAASGLRVAPSPLVLASGKSARLRPMIVDRIGVEMPASGAYTFTSADDGLATVEPDGTVRAGESVGETTVTVRHGEFVQPVQIRVVRATHPTGQIVGTINVPGAFGVAFTRSGAPFAVSFHDGVFQLDAVALTARKVAGGLSGLDLALTADGARAYVARQDVHRVDLVELATGAVVRSSPSLGDAALTDLLGADEQTLWVGTGRGVTVLDATTLSVLQHLQVGVVVHMARHPVQPLLYASANFGGVVEIDVATRTVRRHFSIAGRLQGVVVSPDGAQLYVTDEDGPIHVVDLATGTVSGTIGLGSVGAGRGYGMVISPDGLRLYLSQPLAEQLSIVDLASRTVVQRLAIPGTPRRVALDPEGTLLLVGTEGGGVTVIR